MNLPFFKKLVSPKIKQSLTPNINLAGFSIKKNVRDWSNVGYNWGRLKQYSVELSIVVVMMFAITIISVTNATQRANLPITYQGRLTTSAGVSVTDPSRDFKFAIYDASSGGNCLWATGPGSGVANCSSAGTVALSVNSGLFNTSLGDGTTNNPEIDLNFNSGVYYLEVQVDNESPIGTYETFTPRKQLGSMPFSYNSDLLDGISSTGFAILAGQSGGQTLIGGTGTTDNFVLQSTSSNGDAANGILFKVGNNGTITAMSILNNGKVGIGGTPTEKLTVNQGSINQIPGNPSSTTSVSTGTTPFGIQIVGRYAYVINYGAGSLQIFDISNPSNPSSLSSTLTNNGPRSLFISGKYAYIVNQTANTLQIFDISNPSNPSSLSSTSVSGSEPWSVFVSGKYAYVTVNSSSTLKVFDISNPASPTIIGSTSTGSAPRGIYVSGKYAYVVNYSASTLEIFDISNPATPTSVGSTSTGTNPSNIQVVGRYAYVTNTSLGTMEIFNITNPTSPASIGSALLTAGQPYGISVSGRYAYVTRMSGNTLSVIDVINPASPSVIGSIATGNGPTGIAIAGKHAITTNSSADTLEVFDISGMEASSLVAHSLEAGSLQVRENTNIANQLSVGNSLNVGIGGILSSGPLAVSGRTSGNTLSTFDARNSSGTSLLYVRDDGKIGINTTSPGSELDVKGTLRLSGSTSGYVGLAPAASAGSTTYTLPSADGTNGQVLSTNGSGTLSWATAGGGGGGGGGSVALIVDQKTSGTNGAVLTNSTWNTREINTEVSDPDNIVSISSNEFTLGAGTYLVDWSLSYTYNSTNGHAERHKTRLYNVTDTSVIAYGKGFTNINSFAGQPGDLSGTAYINIAGNKTFSIQHWLLEQNNGTAGLAINDGTPEVYAMIKITKLSGGSQWTTISNDIYYNTGNVGIGTSTPGSKLDVKGTIRWSGSTSGYVGFTAPATAGSTTYTLPSADGTNGQVLTTNGSGTLSWATASGGGGTALKIAFLSHNGGTTYSPGTTTVPISNESDPDNIVTLSANQFTLGAGTYLLDWSTVVPDVDPGTFVYAWMENITDTSDIFPMNYPQTSDQGFAVGNNTVTITSSKTFRIKMIISGTDSGTTTTDSAYMTQIRITKVENSGGSQWTTISNDIYYNTGNVGIGTSTPGSKLDVKGTLRLSGSTSGYVGFAPAATAGSTTYTLPSADGTSGQVLSTNGSGTLSWATASGMTVTSGGSKIQSGISSVSSSSAGSVAFPIAFTSTPAITAVAVTGSGQPKIHLTATSSAGFSWSVAPHGTFVGTVHWIAVGN